MAIRGVGSNRILSTAEPRLEVSEMHLRWRGYNRSHARFPQTEWNVTIARQLAESARAGCATSAAGRFSGLKRSRGKRVHHPLRASVTPCTSVAHFDYLVLERSPIHALIIFVHTGVHTARLVPVRLACACTATREAALGSARGGPLALHSRHA